MSCHNGYPRAAAGRRERPQVCVPLPEGIDVSAVRPGQAHVERSSPATWSRRSRHRNPAKFDRARQLDTCMQCHLEPTSSPLPFQIRRYEQPPFSYIPGRPLGDHFIYFDHAPGSGRDDKFEIAERRVPAAEIGLLSAERDDMRHLPQSARHSPGCEGRAALRVGVCELPPGVHAARSAADAKSTRWRELSRLPHAEAAGRRRCAHAS